MPRLDDPILDTMDHATQEAWLIDAVRDQIQFAREYAPFWSNRLRGVDESKWGSLSDFAAGVPILTKEEFRALRPAELLSETGRSELRIGRWTSGTTGRPTVNFWTGNDWNGLVVSVARALARQAPMSRPTAFIGYRQGHLTGPLYKSVLQRLAATVYERSHHPEDFFSTLDQMELFDFDTLALPEHEKGGKGVGLIDLLDEDPDLLTRKKIRWWLGSSGSFSAESVARAKENGVESVTNLFGSSDIGIFSISCPAVAADFHVVQGSILVEIVDGSGAPVENGQPGRVVVTHLRGASDDGTAETYRGTQIVRLATGDGATRVEDHCACGFTTPRLRDIHRLPA